MRSTRHLAERLGGARKRCSSVPLAAGLGRPSISGMVEPASVNGSTNGRLELLSVREREVLELATLGLTNEQVAQRLDVTGHAVKFHLASIYRKLGVANRTEAAVAYLRGAPDAAPAGGES